MSGINAEHLVFLDESGINTNLTRLYAHALHWKRAVDAAPLNTPTATTVLHLSVWMVQLYLPPIRVAQQQRDSVNT